MKKLFVIAAVLLSVSFAYTQNIVKEGNIFKTEKVSAKADTVVTTYKWKDSKNSEYPIVLNKKTGACYIWKLSKNGKYYRQYLSKEVREQISSEYKSK